jgi:hypothetical protein
MRSAMNRSTSTSLLVAAYVFSIGFVGCVPHWEVDRPPGGRGYGINSFWMESWEASGVRCSLHYWDSRKRDHLIWRRLHSEWAVDNENDLAVFNGVVEVQGSTAAVENWTRAFAVEGTGPPVDISDKIKVLYFLARGTNRAQPLGSYSALLSKRKSADFVFDIGNMRDKSGTLTLSVTDVRRLIHEGKEKGQRLKDLKTGLPYFRESMTSAKRPNFSVEQMPEAGTALPIRPSVVRCHRSPLRYA